MEAYCTKLTERILQLTLEIIYLLTGEDNIVANKTSVDGQNSIMVPLHFLLIAERNNDMKILEVTQKMMELLTGQVALPFNPILEDRKVKNIKVEDTNTMEAECMKSDRPCKEDEIHPEKETDGSSNGNPPESCPHPLFSKDIPHNEQDEHWSNCNISIKNDIKVEEEESGMVKEWKYLEGHKDLYNDVMMASHPALTSPDGSSNGNPPERCPRPLYFQDSTQEDHKILHHDQRVKVFDIKTEVKAEEETVRDNQMSVTEAEMMLTITKVESSLGISPGEHSGRNTAEGHLILPSDYNADNGMAQYSPEASLGTQYIHNSLYDMESSSDSFIFEESNDKSRTVLPNIQPCLQSTDGSPDPTNPEEYSYKKFDAVNLKNGTAEFPFSCPKCEKVFKTKKVLWKHLMGHAGKKLYPCSECDNLYLSNCGLVAHKRLHAGEKNFKCPDCEECFGLKSQLTDHQRAHSEPLTCSECRKIFKNRQQLTRHLRTHTGEKPYSCSECGKSFTLMMHLKRHHLVHTGVKPFACPECWKSFSTKANRDIHLRVHTGERPFFCSHCCRRFARRETLVIHQSKRCQFSRGPSEVE